VRIVTTRYDLTLAFSRTGESLARVTLAHPFAADLLGDLRAHHGDWQVDRALALQDGQAQQLEDGVWALCGRRRIRDGARCMMVIAPNLFRMDLRTMQDSYSVSLRNLSGRELGTPPFAPAPNRVLKGPDGGVVHQNEVAFAWPGQEGARVRIVTRVPSYRGQLELDCAVAAFVQMPG
jgi:hypothetical protein